MIIPVPSSSWRYFVDFTTSQQMFFLPQLPGILSSRNHGREPGMKYGRFFAYEGQPIAVGFQGFFHFIIFHPISLSFIIFHHISVCFIIFRHISSYFIIFYHSSSIIWEFIPDWKIWYPKMGYPQIIQWLDHDLVLKPMVTWGSPMT